MQNPQKMTDERDYYEPKRPDLPEEVRQKMYGSLEWFQEMREEYTDDPKWQKSNRQMHPAEVIAERIVILAYLYDARQTGLPEKRAEKLSKMKQRWWFKASPEEQSMMNNGFDYFQDQVAGMYSELIYMLLWAVNDVGPLAATDKLSYSPEFTEKLKNIREDPDTFIANAKIRSTPEILDALIATYNTYMLTFFSEFYDEPTPPNSNYMIVTCRFISLLYVIKAGDWDEILYETYEDAFMHETGFELEYPDEPEDDIPRIQGPGYVGIYVDENGNVKILGEDEES